MDWTPSHHRVGLDPLLTKIIMIKWMSQELSIPLVATNDCHYIYKEDVDPHDILLCIQTGPS